MGKEEAYKKMLEAVEDSDTDGLLAAINEVINEADPLELNQDGMMLGLKHVGELFGKGEVFLTEMLMAAETFQKRST